MPNTTPEGWIATVCKASQNKQELLQLYLHLKEINPKVILEIGMHQGYSIEAWDTLFDPDFIIGIESHPEDLKYFPKGNYQYIGLPSTNPDAFLQTKAVLGDKKVDFLFIDGDHTYDVVKADFLFYSKFVRPGGIVAFHDASLRNNPGVEVYKLWKEIAGEYKNKMITAGSEESFGFKAKGTGTGIIWV